MKRRLEPFYFGLPIGFTKRQATIVKPVPRQVHSQTFLDDKHWFSEHTNDNPRRRGDDVWPKPESCWQGTVLRRNVVASQ